MTWRCFGIATNLLHSYFVIFVFPRYFPKMGVIAILSLRLDVVSVDE